MALNDSGNSSIPSNGHDSIDSDPGPMYSKPWVQKLIQQIQELLQANYQWLDIDQTSNQRVLDYACGNGTVSSALLTWFPKATFQGLDIATSQVKRFNDEAARLIGNSHPRMFAIQGDLNHPKDTLNEPQWRNFDAAVISMALHHVPDPTALLSRLHRRVRPGGSIVVIEWLQQSDGSTNTNVTSNEHMIRLSEGPKLWPGFSLDNIRTHLHAAGFVDVESIVYAGEIEAPKEMEGYNRMFVAKAKVAGTYQKERE